MKLYKELQILNDAEGKHSLASMEISKTDLYFEEGKNKTTSENFEMPLFLSKCLSVPTFLEIAAHSVDHMFSLYFDYL